MKAESRHDTIFVFTGGSSGCHNDSIYCNQGDTIGIITTFLF